MTLEEFAIERYAERHNISYQTAKEIFEREWKKWMHQKDQVGSVTKKKNGFRGRSMLNIINATKKGITFASSFWAGDGVNLGLGHGIKETAISILQVTRLQRSRK